MGCVQTAILAADVPEQQRQQETDRIHVAGILHPKTGSRDEVREAFLRVSPLVPDAVVIGSPNAFKGRHKQGQSAAWTHFPMNGSQRAEVVIQMLQYI